MADYYHHVRHEIACLLPTKSSQILDIGAGAGTTLRWLKSIYPDARTTGVELNPNLLDELKHNADVAIIGAIDECLLQLGSYDLILLLDVLEHLPDPARTLLQVSKRLEPTGCVIVSVPNIAHLSVSVPLLFRRQFTYQEAGILDRTHLRFFVEDTAIRLLNDAGLIVTNGLLSGLQGPKSTALNRFSFGLLRHHLTKQYIMQGKLGNSNSVQQDVQWITRTFN